jgi:hypothetical protein
MIKKVFSFIFVSCALLINAQKQPLTYYLPDIKYDATIPTPEQYLGYQIGEWHITHDQMVAYMRVLADKSDRVEIEEYARSHEHRPLVIVKISSPSNIKNEESIRKSHLELSDISKSSSIDIKKQPIIINQGYSIHGNEPSGGNAAILVAYYLAAGQSKEVTDLLDNAFILMDPCLNPDGFTRFSTWANSHKGLNLISDPSSREFNESWPSGRSNHYWFDLNRDWLLLTNPESQGRIKTYHKWLPNVLTDHHEMGTNSTFFFQPGVPSRTNPNTPALNQTLTEEIGTYHAKALDAIGSQYYTKKGFDDFYYGKGSTYPDIHGCIGILFEQASSRGHLQESVNGPLSFAFTIRNQVVTSLSTQKAAMGMKDKLLSFQRDFYKEMNDRAKSNLIKGYVFTDIDGGKMDAFNHLLKQHHIQVEQLTKDASIKGKSYPATSSFVVKLDQKQYGLIKSSFEKVTNFEDSLFYDVSAWTLPLAYDLQYAEVSASELSSLSTSANPMDRPVPGAIANSSAYAYLLPWTDMHTARMVYDLQSADVMTKVSNIEMTFDQGGKKVKVEKGTIIVPTAGQKVGSDKVYQFVSSLGSKYKIAVQPLTTGFSTNAISLGDPAVNTIEKPKVASIVGTGVSNLDAGELWHYLDHRLGLAPTLIDKKDLGRANLDKYNILVMVDGSYNDLSTSSTKMIDDFVKGGGQIIAFKDAINWCKNAGIINVTTAGSDSEAAGSGKMSYQDQEGKEGSKVLGGAIFSSKMDLTHPLCYGYMDDELPVFREGTTFYKTNTNPYSNPVRYSDSPLHSGFLPKGVGEKAKGTSVVSVHNAGSGKVIAINDNLLFRGYWFGGFRMFANALFFGDLISSRANAREE